MLCRKNQQRKQKRKVQKLLLSKTLISPIIFGQLRLWPDDELYLHSVSIQISITYLISFLTRKVLSQSNINIIIMSASKISWFNDYINLRLYHTIFELFGFSGINRVLKSLQSLRQIKVLWFKYWLIFFCVLSYENAFCLG